MFYDLLLVLALLMVLTALFLPLTGGEAITADRVGVFEHVYRIVLLAAVLFYFGWSWTRSGQTVGMIAWRLRLERADGSLLDWKQSVTRMAAAIVSLAAAGLGYFWIWSDRDKLAWHDRWTDTRVIVLPKRQR
jgi:uncharacterized RDD family membrane protein YckC